MVEIGYCPFFPPGFASRRRNYGGLLFRGKGKTWVRFPVRCHHVGAPRSLVEEHARGFKPRSELRCRHGVVAATASGDVSQGFPQRRCLMGIDTTEPWPARPGGVGGADLRWLSIAILGSRTNLRLTKDVKSGRQRALSRSLAWRSWLGRTAPGGAQKSSAVWKRTR